MRSTALRRCLQSHASDNEEYSLIIGATDRSWRVRSPALHYYQQLIALARSHNVRIVGATLPPFEGALRGTPFEGHFSPEKDKVRSAVNQWIRTAGAFDAVVDFDSLLRDPSRPSTILPAFDSGDHLHPGDAGYKAMADAIKLETLFGNEVANRQ
jgi:lysophospholipase L1-like esterase